MGELECVCVCFGRFFGQSKDTSFSSALVASQANVHGALALNSCTLSVMAAETY